MSPFSQAIRSLWLLNGRPSMRAVSLRTHGRISHTSVNQAVNGIVFPRWNTAIVLIEALRGEPHEYRELWLAENEAQEVRRQMQHGLGRRRPHRIATGHVVRPGDRLVFLIPPPVGSGEGEQFLRALEAEFPNNQVSVVVGSTAVLISTEEEEAA